MIASLAKFLDWSSIQLMTLMAPVDDLGSKLEEAVQFLNGPDFVHAESQPAQVEFDSSLHFNFPSPRPCEFEENNVVHGRLYRCAERWRKRPVIILLPGWKDSASYNLRFPLIARHCNRAGFNVATLVPPYHFQRRPRQRREFDRGDCLEFAEGTAQSIAEIRALTGWLLKEGCPAVALWGYSRGAADAGMVACHDARVAAVVMASAPACCKASVEQMAIRPRIHRRWKSIGELCDRFNMTPMNLTALQPAIPRENILLIAGIYDSLCLKDEIENLSRVWGHPDIWQLPHGHVGICCGFVLGLNGRILRWLAPRLNAPAVQARPNDAAR
ncbi:MAG TPA: alpha/beta hydrolase family protein [Candidatus Angelobacter sp.]|nr:alpha/beta hydrolase family protein [Candidatus Angelobacter sp.]